MHDLPTAIVAVTVWSYWACVIALVIRSHLRFRTAAGAMPRTARERVLWWLWVPAILLWQVLPCVAAATAHPLFGLPPLAVEQGGVYVLRLAAAAVGVLALAATIPCWLGMGRNWSMAVVPRKRTRLITTGMFARVRHPIYALSILLMLATMAAVPTPAMIAVGLMHLWMIRGKALSEERFLRQQHGEAYAAYCTRTGRFLPRLRVSETAAADSAHPTETQPEKQRAA
jgi:protein-S-isoprenylcysteine O-methyltransferase Ste14